MKLIIILFLVAGIGSCSQARADNLISIDQIGTNNTVIVNQDGTTQTVKLTVGKDSAVDNSYFNITQQGTGTKTATVTCQVDIITV